MPKKDQNNQNSSKILSKQSAQILDSDMEINSEVQDVTKNSGI